MDSSVRGALGEFLTQRRENGLQSRGVNELIKVRESALTNLRGGKMFLSLLRLTEVFDRSQGTNRRVEECDQVDDKDIVQKQVLVAMVRFTSQVLNMLFQQRNQARPLDRLGPDR